MDRAWVHSAFAGRRTSRLPGHTVGRKLTIRFTAREQPRMARDRAAGRFAAAAALLTLVLATAPAVADTDDRHVSLAYDKCAPNQITLVDEAVEMAYVALGRVIADLGGEMPSKAAEVEVDKWFGVGTETVRVLAIYQLIHKRMHASARPITMICDMTQSLYGWTEEEQPGLAYIGFGRAFFRARLVGGFDTRMGTVIHEMSHMVRSISSEDWVYSTPAAESLAVTKPERALNNADNIEYFVEALTGADGLPVAPPDPAAQPTPRRP